MKKIISLVTLFLMLNASNSFAVGKVQNEDVKTLTELTNAGSTAAHLINDTKIYDTTNSQQLSTSISSGLFGTADTTNALVNSNHQINQFSAAGIANGVSTYVEDGWYIKNSLGTNGVITGSRQTSTLTGTITDLEAKITTAPTAAQTNGTEVYQVLENLDSLKFYGGTASFAVKVKAVGNVNQVGCQFYYATTAVKLTTSIGSEQTATVSTGGYTTCSITAQAIGTSQTTSGVVGVRIRITGVSTGNTYDINNGFRFAQAIMTLSSSVIPYRPRGAGYVEELHLAERVYQIIYGFFATGTSSTTVETDIMFRTPMRVNPTSVLCSTSGGTLSLNNASANFSQSSFSVTSNGLTTTDAELQLNNFTGITSNQIMYNNFAGSGTGLLFDARI